LILDTVLDVELATQRSWPAAIPLGPSLTGIVSTVWFWPGSIRDTVPAAVLVTQTDPAATTTPAGAAPTGMVRAVFVIGSMRDTVPSPPLATQTAPRPVAIAAGAAPTAIVLLT
jgi:hypothetical protein